MSRGECLPYLPPGRLLQALVQRPQCTFRSPKIQFIVGLCPLTAEHLGVQVLAAAVTCSEM